MTATIHILQENLCERFPQRWTENSVPRPCECDAFGYSKEQSIWAARVRNNLRT